MMALGDALAMVVLAERGFSREDYARYHPSGSLGRKLLRVAEIMRTGKELPLVPLGTPVVQVILIMSRTTGRPGAALIVDREQHLEGIFTDGDLRRLLERGIAQLEQPVDGYMGRAPKTIGPDAFVDDAERLLRAHKIDQIAVVDPEGKAIGLVDVQDLLDTRIG
jgi:arabinose-5-phosphate isomerase